MPRDWLYVCKPLRAPFRDGSTVLVRDLVFGLDARFGLAYLGDRRAPLRPGDTVLEAASMGYQPGLGAKARVLGTLISPRHRRRALHFFFTPNPLTSRVLAGLRVVSPRRPMVQSIMSADGVERHVRLLRRLDAVIVMSDHTRRRLVDAGLPENRVVRIHPAVAIPAAVGAFHVPDTAQARMVLYAGDLDPVVAGRLVNLARTLPAGVGLVMACRPKGEGDAEARATLKTKLAEDLESGRFELLTEVEDMDALLRRASLQVFLADHVRKKVDLPLVLLEGLARGVPVVALDRPPVSEIFEVAAAGGRTLGAAVPESGVEERVSAALNDSQTLLQWARDARAVAEESFSLPRMIRDHEALYDRL